MRVTNLGTLKEFTFDGLCRDVINFGFDVSHHFTFVVRQTTVVVYHKTLSASSSRCIGLFAARILRFPARNCNRYHKAKKEGVSGTRKHYC